MMQPPIGPELDWSHRGCSRELNDIDEPQRLCHKPSAWHIIWTVDGKSGEACQDHAKEVRERWVYFGMHAFEEGVCNNPKSFYVHDVDKCVLPEEPHAEQTKEMAHAH